ncbi:hypothetical protein ABZT03_40595 [Streptomyces sp. NPDC005574]|uniref:hypothetical protein n=1 Tax=Streptomyces sp. NPDC005574 TaxID=3156891 RepID=UPI0033B1887E
MAKKPHPSEPSHGEGPSRHHGEGQHGWSPDVDETRQQDNPSAHRSFHADEHAGEPGPGRTKSAQERKGVPGDTVESTGKSGEEYAEQGEEGRTKTGREGRSQRPAGTKDASAYTGVDPKDTPSGRRAG